MSHEIYFANTKFINVSAAALLCSADVGCAALLCSVGRLVVVVVAVVGAKVGVGAVDFLSHHIGKASNNVEFLLRFYKMFALC